jgi:hypothetical protein
VSDDDRQYQNRATNDAFDDDRLLSYALGLDDDPQLAAALATDRMLAQRLEAVRTDVAAVERGVRAAVPPEDGTYADPAGSRWEALRPYFTAAPARSRRGFARRVLAPALVSAAVVLAAIAGVLALRQHTSNVASSGASQHAAAAKANQALGRYQADALTLTQQQLRARAPNYARVALVRAGTAADGHQQFALVRMLKGSPPDSLDLALAGSKPLPPGQVAIAFFDPVTQPRSESGVTGLTGTGASPSPHGSGAALGAFSASAPAAGSDLRLLGHAVIVLVVPEGVDPAALLVPSPTATPAR